MYEEQVKSSYGGSLREDCREGLIQKGFAEE